MRIEPWQIPILVMASIVVLEYVVRVTARRWNAPIVEKRVRTTALGLLAALLLVIFVRTVGTSTADRLATLASAVVEIVTLWLTYQSYRDLQSSKGKTTPEQSGSPD